MNNNTDVKLLRSIKTGKGLIKLFNNLKTNRSLSKITGNKRSTLTKKKRELVLAKTDGRCHICGIKLNSTNFQADHVYSHSAGGAHAENNYLAACFTCNNYRWHYPSEEIRIILKLLRMNTRKLIVKDGLAVCSRAVLQHPH